MKSYQRWINHFDPNLELKNTIFIEIRKNKLRDAETQNLPKTIFPHNIGFSLEMNLKQIESQPQDINTSKKSRFQAEAAEEEIVFNGEFLKRYLV